MRGALVAFAVVAVALAGCADSKTPDTATTDGPCVVESADDYACAEKDQNKTADQVAHVHDYWRGQETVRLQDETKSLGRGNYAKCESYPIRVWLPPDGSTVYQGTGLVDITTSVEYERDHMSGPLEIWVKRADQDSAEYVADLEDDATVTMEINASAADLPHQVLSAWEFWVYANPVPTFDDVYCMVQPRATITFEIDIHKTLEVDPFPGHPDHWNGTDELPLLDAFGGLFLAEEQVGNCLSGDDPNSHAESNCQMYWRGFGPQNGTIVPPGAATVQLTLALEPSQWQPDTQFGLLYHGADTREFQHVEPASRDGDTAVYEIPVGDTNDGPYAEQSQWRFQLVNESDHGTYRGEWSLAGSVVRADA